MTLLTVQLVTLVFSSTVAAASSLAHEGRQGVAIAATDAVPVRAARLRGPLGGPTLPLAPATIPRRPEAEGRGVPVALVAARVVPQAATFVPEGAAAFRRTVPIPRASGRTTLAVLEAGRPVPVIAVTPATTRVGAAPIGALVLAGVAGRRARPARAKGEVALPGGAGVGTLLGRPVVRADVEVAGPLVAPHPIGEAVGQGPRVVAVALAAQAVPVLTGPNHVAA